MSILNLSYEADYGLLFLKSGPIFHPARQIFTRAVATSYPVTIYPLFISRYNQHDDFVIYACLKSYQVSIIVPDITSEMIASLGVGEKWYIHNCPTNIVDAFKTVWTYALSPSGYLTYLNESANFSIYYLNKHYFDIICSSYGLKV